MVVEVGFGLGVQRLTAPLGAVLPPTIDDGTALDEAEEVLRQRYLAHSGCLCLIGVPADSIERELPLISALRVGPKMDVVVDHRFARPGSVGVSPQILAPIWSRPARSVM